MEICRSHPDSITYFEKKRVLILLHSTLRHFLSLLFRRPAKTKVTFFG
ncbi:hypothetical protein LEP1GSC058_0055 [Leptospira fainei serovar Hurstbridge str. BUT 6]|uniref:Uncharacterized protein n=1 Tax=Leptospira fainei serovar Hurstbridge str. BUT 6 TaxID=1193011 RepID=S3VF51_9LEPT|nr:hypothetical protein LEP1GSC058_0055 [Leptospira fainei serovar Hurstbridge str. BUT 6]